MKIPFVIETQLNKITKPQLVSVVETFINGKKQKKFYGKSLTANFLQALYASMNQNDSVNYVASGAPFNSLATVIRQDTGAQSAVVSNAALFRIDGGVGVLTRGIILSANTDAITPISQNLVANITNGTGAGQLLYLAQASIQGVNIVGAQSSFIIERNFDNQSGGNVTVNKLGIVTNPVTGGYYYYIDAVSPSDVIANNELYTVRITFSITT